MMYEDKLTAGMEQFAFCNELKAKKYNTLQRVNAMSSLGAFGNTKEIGEDRNSAMSILVALAWFQ